MPQVTSESWQFFTAHGLMDLGKSPKNVPTASEAATEKDTFSIGHSEKPASSGCRACDKLRSFGRS